MHPDKGNEGDNSKQQYCSWIKENLIDNEEVKKRYDIASRIIQEANDTKREAVEHFIEHWKKEQQRQEHEELEREAGRLSDMLEKAEEIHATLIDELEEIRKVRVMKNIELRQTEIKKTIYKEKLADIYHKLGYKDDDDDNDDDVNLEERGRKRRKK